MRIFYPTAKKNSIQLIAENLRVNVNSLESTDIPYTFGFSAKNIVPYSVKIFGTDGIINQAEFVLKLDNEILKKFEAKITSLLGSTDKSLVWNIDSVNDSIALSDKGLFSIECTKINGSTATIAVQVFGVKT